eukprot:49032-Chlamydomonas_euryale.AAC.1
MPDAVTSVTPPPPPAARGSLCTHQHQHVDEVCEALGARLVEPCVLLLAALVAGERGGVGELGAHVVKDGQQHGVKDAAPERVGKRAFAE